MSKGKKILWTVITLVVIAFVVVDVLVGMMVATEFISYWVLTVLVGAEATLLALCLIGWSTTFIAKTVWIPELVIAGKLFASPQSWAVKAVRYGENGEFIKFLYDPHELTIEPVTGEVKETEPIDRAKIVESFWHKRVGAEWIGLPPHQIAGWEMRWSRTTKPGDKTTDSSHKLVEGTDVVHRLETVYYLRYKHVITDVWVIRLGGNDGSDAVITASFTLELRNARHAILEQPDWYTLAYAAVDQELQKFVLEYKATNEKWKGNIKDPYNNKKSTSTMTLLKKVFEKPEFLTEFQDKTGFKFSQFTFTSSDPRNVKLQEANQALAIATQNNKVVVVNAVAEAKATETKADAEKYRLEKIALGNKAGLVAELEGVGNDLQSRRIHLGVRAYKDIPQGVKVLNIGGRGGQNIVDVGDVNDSGDKT